MNEYEALIKRSLGELDASEVLIQYEAFNASVSRTYYAMFYAVQALFVKQNIVSSSHNGTISTFSKLFVNTGILPKTLGRALNDIFEMRQSSDYDYVSFVAREKAIEVLNTGKHFVTTILEHLKK